MRSHEPYQNLVLLMTWNWEQKKWPACNYEIEALAQHETRFLHQAGMVHGGLQASDGREQNPSDDRSHQHGSGEVVPESTGFPPIIEFSAPYEGILREAPTGLALERNSLDTIGPCVQGP